MSSAEETYRSWSKQQFTDVLGETSESDIGELGHIAAGLSITAFTLLCYGIVFIMITYGYTGIWPFCKKVCLSSWNFYDELFIVIRSLINDLNNKYF